MSVAFKLEGEMTMVERVARAICLANCDQPDEVQLGFLTDSIKGTAWMGYVPQARAAIEAMREPTEAMMRDGAWSLARHAISKTSVPTIAAEIFVSMIDAALAD